MAKKRVTDLSINWLAGQMNTVYATWDFKGDHLENYTVIWYYGTGQGVWFEGSNSTTTAKNATYSVPENARVIKVKVKPNSKKKSGKKTQQKTYWTGEAVETHSFDTNAENRINTPAAPSEVTIKNGMITATLIGYDNDGKNSNVTHIRFQIILGDTLVLADNLDGIYDPNLKYASVSYATSASGTYKVRCCALTDEGFTSDWSDFTSSVTTRPAKVEGVAVEALSESSVKITWTGSTVVAYDSANVTEYEVAYVKDDVTYFDTNPDEVTTVTTEGSNPIRVITGLDNAEGPTYYFRVRAKNESDDHDGYGDWSDIVSTVLGTKPEPPTTWSYTTVAEIGENVVLSWVHSSEDNSTQTAAQIDITISGVTTTIQIPGVTGLAADTNTYEYATNDLADGTEVSWCVRTKGAHPEYSESSTVRKFIVYQKPELSLGLYDDVTWYWNYLDFNTGDILGTDGHGESLITDVTKYPFVLAAEAFPNTQNATSFAIDIIANDSYETIDDVGLIKNVYSGSSVYSGFFIATSNMLTKVFRPADVDLEDGVSYTITVTVSMDSGLSASKSLDFTVHWEEEELEPNAEITINLNNFACYIRPYCELEDGSEEINVYLSVYRREYDGRFTAIAENLDGALRSTVVDPHPSLDFARYRVVAVSKVTGAVGYYDLPAEAIGGDSIVIQWDETWRAFNDSMGDSADLVNQPVQGSMLVLPYNIDVSADSKPDVALVEYIGRQNPVSYYGTQRGETTRWSCEVPKKDSEMLYQIRRLAAYMGDVYVREPSGIGYWANITVSYNLQHSKMSVPVTFNITRVEGGV